MNFNPIRKLVSGNKTRLKDSQIGVELDLCYLTNQIILMGFPASGIETIYRNSRKQVKRWLEARHGLDYRIYNFCPLTENHYDGSYFNHQVHRFPFPDHHPPPLSMIPLFVSDIASFLDRSSLNMAVIHCKAGKGRSGTMSISYLMTLLALPDDFLPPASKHEPSTDSMKPFVERVGQDSVTDDTKPLSVDLISQTTPTFAAAATALPSTSPCGSIPVTKQAIIEDSMIDLHLPSERLERDEETFSRRLHLEDIDENGDMVLAVNRIGKLKTGDSDKTPTVPSESERFEFGLTTNSELMRRRITDLLRYHTTRRMLDPNSSRNGVSIPSQRRWLAYWGEILCGKDARLLLNFLPKPPGHVEIKWIKIRLNRSEHYFNLVTFKTKIAVQLAHYKSSYIDSIDRAEQDLHQSNSFPKAQFLNSNPPGSHSVRESPAVELDIDWEDSSDLVMKFASFGENPSHPSSASSGNTSFFDGSSSIGTLSSSTSRRPESVSIVPQSQMRSENTPTSQQVSEDFRAKATEEDEDDDEEEGCLRLLTPVRLYPNPQSASNSKDLKKKVKGGQAIRSLGGVRIDPTREVQCKFVIGSTGSKHASLMTDIVSLGYLWFIPAFHSTHHQNSTPTSSDHLKQSTSSSSTSSSNPNDSSSSRSIDHPHYPLHHGEIITNFDNHQIDFCHLNLLSHVQICWQFDS